MNRLTTVLFLAIVLLASAPGSSLLAGSLPAIEVEEDDEAIITIESFLNVIRNHADMVLWIDTRDPGEIAADGTFSKARVIPVEKLEGEIPNLPNDRPIIFFCSTGARSGEAYDFLMMKRNDIEAYFLEAAVSFKGKDLPVVTEVED